MLPFTPDAIQAMRRNLEGSGPETAGERRRRRIADRHRERRYTK